MRIAHLWIGLILLALSSLSGCTVVAAVLDKVQPDPVEPATYAPAHENMLVLVENYHNPALLEDASEHLNQLIVTELIDFKVAPIVNPDRLTLLRTADPQAYQKLSIPQVGAALQAKQVLYADVTQFIIQSAVGTEALTAHAEARVKIVDVATGQTRWPRDATSAGIPVLASVPFYSDNTNANEPAIREALTRALASRIAALFHNVTSERSPNPAYPESDHLSQ